MSTKALTKESIQKEITKCKINIENFDIALKHIPESSVLGYLCVVSSLKKEKKKLQKLENELSIRNK